MEKHIVEEEEDEELVSKPIHANGNQSVLNVIINGVPPSSTYNYDSSYNTYIWDHNCDIKECPPPHKKHFCINTSDNHHPNIVNIYKVPNLNNKPTKPNCIHSKNLFSHKYFSYLSF